MLQGRETPARWWERGIIYQIYPRSFQDSDGDGVGDLRGIAQRLDYLQWLGVDAVWISPFYPSPMADFGYDVSDHCGVHPIFGTLADFDHLLREAHRRGLRVVLDFVPNHTSVEHPWFRESRRSRDDPRRSWYVWRDPAPDGGPPNNWISAFGGSAWQWDGATGQFYLHIFLREQPDLNWRNPEVRAAMLDVLRCWLDRGVDGFRVDAVQNLIKDERFRDNPPNPDYQPGVDDPYDRLLRVHSSDQPEVHELIAQMRELVEEYGADKILIGEIYNTPERSMAYYGHNGRGCHFPHNFQLIRLPWEAHRVAGAVERYERILPPDAWPNWVLGNHDRARVASRVGPEQARVAAMLLLTLRGTPTLYYGDEIGMRDVPIPPDRVQDPWELNLPGLGLGRDKVRTPMQWDASNHAGFSAGEPWLPLAGDFGRFNVEVERTDPTSMLTLYRRLIQLRRDTPALQLGSYAAVAAGPDVVSYVRRSGDQRVLVALNLSSEPRPEAVRWAELRGRVLISTHLDREDAVREVVALRSSEGVVVRLE